MGASGAERDFKYWGVYVMQAEPLLATATVKETIMTSALLRLPLSISRKEKMERVSNIIAQLGLQHCQGTMVGDEGTGMGVRGISGGERKRVTVGVGLVTQPHVLLLDEPTSGLDSETAVSIVELMRDLARQGRTVVTTIHQPNSTITDCFDDLLLLSFGNLIYMGKWAKSVEYFSSLGYRCPMYTNPSDFYMSLMKDEDASPKLVELWKKEDDQWVTTPRLTAPEQQTPFTNGSKVAEVAEADEAAALNGHSEDTPNPKVADIEMGEVSGAHERANGEAASTTAKSAPPNTSAGGDGNQQEGKRGRVRMKSLQPPAWYQVWVLSIRNVQFYLRNPELMLAKLFTYIFMGGFMGLMYLRLPLDTATAGYNRSAALWISMFAFTLMPSETACSVWNQERAVITKEVKSGQYRLSSFFLAKTLVSVPFETVIAIIFTVIIYHMIGFQAKADKYLIFMVTLILVNLISEMVGFIGGVVTKEVTIGLILISVVTYFCFAFSGFIVQPIPKYFVWLHKISYYSLAYTILVKNEFTGLNIQSPIDPVCSAELNFIPPPPANNYPIAQNIGFLVLIAVGIRVVAFALLWFSFATLRIPKPLQKPWAAVKNGLGFCFC
ncbi:g3937 [Coccomyxa elongata]